MIRYPIGISTFRELTTGNYSFVDKTLFVKDFIEEGSKVVLISRPRRFGKTLTLSMCDDFFNIENIEEENIFANLKISEHKDLCEEHQNKYPTIFISFKDVKQSNFDSAIEQVGVLLRNLYKRNENLLEGNFLSEDEREYFYTIINEKASKTQMQSAVNYLSLLLDRKHNKKPILFIDEYDTPIHAAYLENYYQDMIKFMREFFGISLKEMGQSKDLHYHKALITGISRIAQESMFSGLNNFKAYTMLNKKYGNYFGFTEKEVIELLDKAKINAKLDDIKAWYNGYNIGGHIIYNAWSIINCLCDGGLLQNYWVNTSSNDLIKNALDKISYGTQTKITDLIQGTKVKIAIDPNLVFTDLDIKETALWSLLLHTGHLNVLSFDYEEFENALVEIPNKEVMWIYKSIFRERFLINKEFATYNRFLKTILDADFEEFKLYIADYLQNAASFFDFNKNTSEQVFHSFMIGIILGLSDRYKIVSNRESGRGRLDVAIIPKDNSKCGICLEFKVSDSKENMKAKANEALKQIKDKNYIQMFHEHDVKEVHGLGLAFFGKEVEMIHECIKTAKI